MGITEIRNVYCKDDKVGDLLRAMAGLVVVSPIPVPVANAAVVDGKIVAASKAGNVAEMYLEHLAATKPKQVRTEDFKAFAKVNGRGPSYAAHIRDTALEAKVIRRVSRGVFNVISK